METGSLAEAAAKLRHFNRFYTARIGVLDRDILGSGWSLSEARVLYELASRETLTASELIEALSIDAGYLSRLLKRFEKSGLIEKRVSNADRRSSHIALTPTGRKCFATLDRLSQKAAESLLDPIPNRERGDLLDALNLVETALQRESLKQPVTFRQHRVGDMGWIVHRQARAVCAGIWLGQQLRGACLGDHRAVHRGITILKKKSALSRKGPERSSVRFSS